jgi:hypothetical protein
MAAIPTLPIINELIHERLGKSMGDASFWQSIATQRHAHAQRYQPWLGEGNGANAPFTVVVIGAPGVGKSTLLRQLIHPLPLAAGTTPWPVSVFTPEPPVLWTDTPGWSSDQAPAIRCALEQADVCLWVVTEPDTSPPELGMMLKTWGRPVVKVIHVRGGAMPAFAPPQGNLIATVAVRLFPHPQPLRREWPDGRVEWDTVTLAADLTPLQTLVADLLTSQTAIRTVNQLQHLADRERQWAHQQGQMPVAWAPVLVKSLLLTLSPGGWLSLGLSLGTDLVTLVFLSRRLHLPFTRHGINRLLVALVVSSATAGWLGEVGEWGGMMALGQGLWGGLTSYGLQRVARTYLQQGMTWQADGPDRLLRQIYQHLTPGTWLHTWVASLIQPDLGKSDHWTRDDTPSGGQS